METKEKIELISAVIRSRRSIYADAYLEQEIPDDIIEQLIVDAAETDKFFRALVNLRNTNLKNCCRYPIMTLGRSGSSMGKRPELAHQWLGFEPG